MSQFKVLIEHLCQFLQWWKEGLLSCLPDGFRKKWLGSSQSLLLTLQDNRLILSLSTNSKIEELKSYSLPLESKLKGDFYKLLDRYNKRYLLISKADILTSELSLPAVTQKNLATVVGFEIDRLTPYKMNEVYFEPKVHGRSNEGRNILVKVYLIPKIILDGLLEKITSLNIRLDGVKVHGEDIVVNILPKSIRSGLNKTEKNARLLWIVSFALLLFALGTPLVYLRQKAIFLEKKAAILIPKAQALSEEEARLGDLINANNFLFKRKSEIVPMLIISNELSRLMPLDAYIEALDYDGKRIIIRGIAKQASQLSSLLESSSYFKEITQTSPIISDGQGNERFGFSMKVERDGP